MTQNPGITPIGPTPLDPMLSVVMVAVIPFALLFGALLVTWHHRREERGKRATVYVFCALAALIAAWYLEAWWPLAVTLVAIPLMMLGGLWTRRRVTNAPQND